MKIQLWSAHLYHKIVIQQLKYSKCLRLFTCVFIWISTSLSVQTFHSTTLPWGGSTATSCPLRWRRLKNGKEQACLSGMTVSQRSGLVQFLSFDLRCRSRDLLGYWSSCEEMFWAAWRHVSVLSRYVGMLGSLLKGELRLNPSPSFLLCLVLHGPPKLRADGGKE